MADSPSAPDNSPQTSRRGLIARVRQAGAVTLLGAVLVGFLLGWLVMGWWLVPVRWSEVYPNDLRGEVRGDYVEMVADSYQLTGEIERAAVRLQYWQTPELAQLLTQRAEALERDGNGEGATRLRALNDDLRLSAPEASPEPKPEEGGGSGIPWRTILLVAAVLFLLAVAAVLVRQIGALWQEHRDRQEHAPEEEGDEDAAAYDAGPDVTVAVAETPPTFETQQPFEPEPASPPAGDVSAVGAGRVVEQEEAVRERPQAGREPRMQTAGPPVRIAFKGEIDFDETQTIQTAEEYRGEYGVSISEVVGGSGGKVRALEVWLFDKSGIRTLTATLLHPDDFNDEAIRRRFSSDNDIAVALREGAMIRLSTETLAVTGVTKAVRFGQRTAEGTPIELADFEFVSGVAA